MATPVHPRVYLRGAEPSAASGTQVRVLVYAPSPIRSAWIESELAHKSVIVQLGFSIDHVVSALVEDPPPRPQILVADFDDMDAGELMHLHVLREQGWFGRIIALGDLPPALRSSLAIERVLDAPFVRDALRDVITETAVVALTTRLPVL
jgi:hypothetical protein